MGSRLIHESLPVGILQCNCHVLGDAETREALVLDPGDEIERIQEILTRHKLKVCAIVSTHAHIDHVGGIAKLARATGAPVMLHEADMPLYQHLDVQAAWIGMPPPEMAAVDQFLREGDSVRWGAFEARVLHTPGHSPGSVTLYLPAEPVIVPTGQPRSDSINRAGDRAAAAEASRLFAGDTLFAGSIGRTDLWGGSYEGILASIRGKLLPLPDDTIVFPGHGPSTTIGREREANPFLQRG
jgi:glyoxylase-like metal-dependent hydrolase (beta-lactamase superfamily II)